MSPELRQELEKLNRKLDAVIRGEDVNFIQNISRRLDIDRRFKNIRLNDLVDVDTDGVTNGQVIKYVSSSTTWTNQNDIDT